ncbi:BTB/POZ domain-containing protein 2-like [Oryza brachyantha]|uniref:Uncharacterized protein n=1 Tax=Oryza brachyantha TaxID=4533 RepID=J3MB05_ORYBR|nr:BTB/POZ domain-containing protein 2-like [Oryza brachyantha]
MERIIAMSVVGAGPGNVFGPGMSAGALESFVHRRQPGAGNKAASAAAAEGTGRGKSPPSSEARAAPAEAKSAAAKGGGAGARFDPALDLDGLYCFETISPH